MYEWAPMHLVGAGDADAAVNFGLEHPGYADGIAGLLHAIRAAATASTPEAGDDRVKLVLPAPGAVTGLPANTDFSRAALNAGQAVIVGTSGNAGIGVVPVVEGPDVLRWTVYSIVVPEHGHRDQGLGEAEYEMREAVRGAADALAQMQSLPTRTLDTDPRTRIAALIADAARHRYPAEMSDRAFRVLESADRVAAILTVAAGSAPSEAPTASAAAAREELVRPLWAAVRTARTIAVATSIEAAMHSA
ncbi:hypothetical protein CH296_22485 [Rhodococcus sp. 14-2496-1d]|nr:hypothetical protein CH249_21985 [Rhodococcus sp. 05-2255-3B1]OZE09046.1 hypothetical protein CH250_15260 [Rhodococcus sp. 05-2255-3C]OZE17992.1 hypothetical protein CH255_15255 [Rhodococcus sp. 05-2255-2A2]OZF26965.1 hypothetical protein CH296_22485 [Rhodococcus sp. 14-2496-1d]